MAAAISSAFSGASHEFAGFSVKARDAARALTHAVTALDQQIGALASALDPAEARRLLDKIAALGPHRGAGDLNSEVREILQKQLDAVRSVEARIEEARSRRTERFERLHALWVLAIEARAAAGNPSQVSGTTDRLHRLLTDIEASAGAKANSPLAATEALSDAPTIER